MIGTPARKAKKLANFVKMYENSPGMAQKVAQARKELIGYERLAKYLASRRKSG